MPPVGRYLYHRRGEGGAPRGSERNQTALSNVSSGKSAWSETEQVAVHVGTGVVTLYLPASRSLKDKRQVARSLTERLRRQFNVAVAEVEEHDAWQTLVLGLVVVSNQAGHAGQQVERVIAAIESARLDAEIVDRQVGVMAL